MAAALSEVLAQNPDLQPVTFYRLHCAKHGSFRIAASSAVHTCPVCALPVRFLYMFLNIRGATRRALPAVESWRGCDVAPLTETEKANLATFLRSEDQVLVTPCRKKGKPRGRAISAVCGAGRHSSCYCADCPCRCHGPKLGASH